MKHHLSIDLETFSSVPIGKAGAYKYVQSPDFEILLFAYSLNDSPVVVVDLAQGEVLPDWLYKAIESPEYIKHAYNAAFEWYCLSKFYGHLLPVDQWRDTMLHGLYCGYTAGLDATGKALGLPAEKQKLSVGKALIRYFCVPCTPTQSNGGRHRNLPKHDPDKWEMLKTYCLGDVTTEKENAPFLGLFTATDIDGNPVDQTLFADYKLTMINVWATYCSPCINEMPDLGRLHADMAAEGVQIVGLVSDALDSSGNISQSQVDLARDIIEATGANYPHMLPSQDLISTVLWQVTAVPTTIFVDHTGELVGYAYAGSRSYDQWTAIIYDTLSLLEDASEETSEPAEESADAAGEAEA